METESFSITPITETSKLDDEAHHVDHADHGVLIVPSESNHVEPQVAADLATVFEVAVAAHATAMIFASTSTDVPIPTVETPASVMEMTMVVSSVVALIHAIPLAFITIPDVDTSTNTPESGFVAMTISAIEKTNGKTSPCTSPSSMLSDFDAWLSKQPPNVAPTNQGVRDS
ncbi:hypothetical protein V6N13_074555 [Hibiscus sabdariffa]|uniref:Uncharacterized protein n=1 Tax=Hibiscus sabdariffa TaxID=183260 RepID=A0ABR2U999_9ROSI